MKPLFITSVFILVSCDRSMDQTLNENSKQAVASTPQALLDAVIEQNIKYIDRLLNEGVSTEQKDIHGKTSLRIAVEINDARSVLRLLKFRADVSSTTADKVSILGVAVEKGDDTVINNLISFGADVTGLMPNGEQALFWAVRQGKGNVLQAAIKSGTDPNTKNSEGDSLIHIAVSSNQREITDALIILGADLSVLDSKGETTVHQAFRQNWLDLVPTFVRAGANPNLRLSSGLTLLDQAVIDKNSDHISLLLKAGADPNTHDSNGIVPSPFLKAFNSGDIALFEIFLNHKVSPPRSNWNPWLWQVFENRNSSLFSLLLKHGAKATEPRADHLCLLEAAVMANEPLFVKMLVDSGSPSGNALTLAISKGDIGMVNFLIASGLPINPDNIASVTPLNAAIRGRYDPIAALLIQKGADTHLKMSEGQSPLHLAIATGCEQTVTALLDGGADPNSLFEQPISDEFSECVKPGVIRWHLKNDSNITPLMVAADLGNMNIADRLIKAGAKIEVRTTKTKMWPIDFACQREDVKMARLILGKNPHQEERQMTIDLSDQQARLVGTDGIEIISTKVSTGRKGFATPKGVFVITHKNRDWTSTVYHASMPYFQRLSCRDFGLHQGVVPGRPASHGCIRVPSGTAAKLFKMMQIGDRVEIVP